MKSATLVIAVDAALVVSFAVSLVVLLIVTVQP